MSKPSSIFFSNKKKMVIRSIKVLKVRLSQPIRKQYELNSYEGGFTFYKIIVSKNILTWRM